MAKNKNTNADGKKPRLPGPAIAAIAVVLGVINPALIGLAVFSIAAIFFVKASREAERKRTSRDYMSGQAPPSGREAMRSMSREQRELEKWVSGLNVPNVVKHKVRQIAEVHGWSIQAVLDSPETPEVVKKYVRKGMSGGAGAVKALAVPVERTHADIPALPDDDIYDPDAYESVNMDLSAADPSTVLINGRRHKFRNKKNPFEM